MESVSARPPYGSVDEFTRILRRTSPPHLNSCALGLVSMIANTPDVAAAVKVEHIGNVVSAVVGIEDEQFERDDEITRLRARVAELESRDDGQLYSRPADDPTPVSGARVEAHVGGMTEAKPVTVYFSFGHGHTDPDTGEDLLDHYVTIVGPSYEACVNAMFRSRYGDRWGVDYLAGSAKAEEWIPQWTEHERIDLFAPASDS